MSFRTNQSVQMTLSDGLFGLTPRELKALEKSWAKIFADDIFPAINEEPFRVLYSDKASRPNTPINVIIGALIIKELFNYSDDEMVESLMLDFRLQYALHTTSFMEQPLSDKTLTRFRIRCYDYEQLHGVDLLHDCVKDLAAKTAELMKIDGRIKRMDSMMIEANIRKLSRMELLYRCIAKLVVYLHESGHDDLVETLEHYYDPNDFNRVIYHARSTDADDRIQTLLHNADLVIKNCGHDFDDVTEYQLLVRCLTEQTVVVDHTRRLKTKEDGAMDSNVLQNPSDPDATYRRKAGKEHRGYVSNLEESVGKNGSIVTDYQFEKNNSSDSAMLRDNLEAQERSEEEIVLIADGAYSGSDNSSFAESKNIKLVTTDLTGRDPDPFVAGIELNENGTRVTKCPMGNVPKTSNYVRQTGMCTASFDRDLCANCPHKDQCKAKIFKRVAKIQVSKKTIERSQTRAFMKTEEFKNYARLRNGVETIPSYLRNAFHADRMPVRGLIRSRFFFGGKVAALNFRKLFRYRMGLGNYALNPVLGG